MADHGITRAKDTTAVPPVATCHQSPYLHKPGTVIMTSFSLWYHSLLTWPCPSLRTYGQITAF